MHCAHNPPSIRFQFPVGGFAEVFRPRSNPRREQRHLTISQVLQDDMLTNENLLVLRLLGRVLWLIDIGIV
jgi:hypothetical protein